MTKLNASKIIIIKDDNTRLNLLRKPLERELEPLQLVCSVSVLTGLELNWEAYDLLRSTDKIKFSYLENNYDANVTYFNQRVHGEWLYLGNQRVMTEIHLEIISVI